MTESDLQDCSRRPVPGNADWPPERPGRRGGLGGEADLPHHKLPAEARPSPREARQGRPPTQNRSVGRSAIALTFIVRTLQRGSDSKTLQELLHRGNTWGGGEFCKKSPRSSKKSKSVRGPDPVIPPHLQGRPDWCDQEQWRDVFTNR